jgi:hypothetical protein
MSTARLLGRTTASTGAVEEISVGSELSLSSGTLNGAGPLVKTLTDAATVAVDLESRLAVLGTVTITATRTLGEPSNLVDGQVFALDVVNDGNGAWGLNYHASWAAGFPGAVTPEISTALNSRTRLVWRVRGSTPWLEFVRRYS